MWLPFKVDEIPVNLTLVCTNEPGAKLVLLCVASLKVVEPTDTVQ